VEPKLTYAVLQKQDREAHILPPLTIEFQTIHIIFNKNPSNKKAK